MCIRDVCQRWSRAVERSASLDGAPTSDSQVKPLPVRKRGDADPRSVASSVACLPTVLKRSQMERRRGLYLSRVLHTSAGRARRAVLVDDGRRRACARRSPPVFSFKTFLCLSPYLQREMGPFTHTHTHLAFVRSFESTRVFPEHRSIRENPLSRKRLNVGGRRARAHASREGAA